MKKGETLIEAALENVLTSLKKKYPTVIEDISFSIGIDHADEEAVFVTVTLKDRKKSCHQRYYSWKDVKPIEQVIRHKVSDVEPFRFAYIGFQLKSEAYVTNSRKIDRNR